MFTLNKRILLVAAIPTICCLFLSLGNMHDQYRESKLARSFINNVDRITQISSLIGFLQVERGMSAVYIKSKRTESYAIVQDKIDKTDDILGDVSSFVLSFDTGRRFTNLSEGLEGIKATRILVQNEGSANEVVRQYTEVIKDLRIFIQRLAEGSDLLISKKLTGLTILERSRENAGLLRANLSGIFAADGPIDYKTLGKIYSFKDGVADNLYSEDLSLGQAAADKAETMRDSSSWKRVEEVFEIVISSYREGSYGVDPTQFFTVITQSVDNIKKVIDLEIADTEKKARAILTKRENRMLQMGFMAIGLIAVLLIVIVLNIRMIRKNINTISAGIDSNSQIIGNFSDKLESQSQTLREGVTQQASSITETAASLEEISSMVKNNLGVAESARDCCKEVLELVKYCNITATQKLNGAMSEIKNTTDQTHDLITILEEVKVKTEIIDEIVFQTKLLSFNASVEAERAGENGRGFAVVAQEVGNLALNSGKASKQISQIVNETIEKARVSIEENIKSVDNGMSVLKELAPLLKKISEQTKGLMQQSESIFKASKEQSFGVNQISDSMSELDSVTQKNSESSEENTRVGAELRKITGSLNSEIYKLKLFTQGLEDSNIPSSSELDHTSYDPAA